MIDRSLVRYFLAVADSGSFSRAAERVNISQPALSVAIGKLEKQLGVDLFDRSNRRVHLTAAGAQFLPYARRIEGEFNAAVAAIQAGQPTRKVRIGVLNTIPTGIVQFAIATMLQSASGSIRFELVERSEKELASLLERDRISAAVTLVGRSHDRFCEIFLYEEDYRAAMPANHPCAGRSVIEAEELAGSVMIVRRHCEALAETSRHFTERGIRPFFSFRSSNDDRVVAMVSAGLGLTVMPASYCMQGVWLARLSQFGLTRKIGLMYPRHADTEEILHSTAISVFQDAVLGEANRRLEGLSFK